MMRTLTITEALAELKTLDKRIEKKIGSISSFVMRQDAFKDPLEKQGGSVNFIIAERQAISDLQDNAVSIRAAIQAINSATRVAAGGVERSITEWLIWRRDVAPKQQAFLASIRKGIDDVRKKALQQGQQMVAAGSETKSTDIIVNVDEKKLAEETEQLENTLGVLDGLLSLKNATVTITV